MEQRQADRPDGLQARIAANVETTLRDERALDEMRRWGFQLTVVHDERAISVRATPPPGRADWPAFESRIAAERWWSSTDPNHSDRVGVRLAAELRAKWERWLLEPGG